MQPHASCLGATALRDHQLMPPYIELAKRDQAPAPQAPRSVDRPSAQLPVVVGARPLRDDIVSSTVLTYRMDMTDERHAAQS
jgi:hypothetical protein